MAGNFIRLQRQKLEAAKSGNTTASTGKPIEHMSLEELEARERELRWEMSKEEIERLEARRRANEAGSGSGGPRALSIPRKQSFSLPRKKLPRWK